MSTTAPLADPTTVVHALIDQIPGLVGILNAIQPAPAPGLLGPRLRLLWGRDHVDEEIAGFLLRVRFSTDMPANPQAMSVLVDAVIRAADMRPSDVAVDLHAHTPLLTMAMARAGDGATGAVRGRQAVEDAWYAAKWNGVTNALFTTRDGAGVLAAAAGRRRPEVVAVSARGQGLDPDTIAAVAAAQVPRVVYLARSVATCARDLVAWQQAGYAPALVQPVDLLPQTSHVHLVAALRRRG
jgi:23S rRNA (uracil1939-C5)-methyltransferase